MLKMHLGAWTHALNILAIPFQKYGNDHKWHIVKYLIQSNFKIIFAWLMRFLKITLGQNLHWGKVLLKFTQTLSRIKKNPDEL